jgi:Flp pilus assembly protein TadD
MKRLLVPFVFLLAAACGGARPAAQTEPAGEGGSTASVGKQRQAEVMRLFMDATQARLAGQAPKAAALYQQCLKADPANSASMFELAKLNHQGRNASAALAYAKQAVATDKDNIWYRFLLADLYREGGRPAEAAEVYRGVVSRWPDRYEVHLDLAAALAQAGKTNDALRVYADMEKRFGLSEELVNHQFSTLMAAGRWDDAEKLARRAMALHPGDAQYVVMLAEAFDERGQHESALERYREALAMDPGNSMLRISLAEHYYATGKMEEAYQQLGEAFLDPDLDIDAKMQVLIGFFEMTQHEGENAGDQARLIAHCYALIDALERAHPESGKPNTIHGDFLLRDGKANEARAQFKAALAKEKDRYPIHLQVMQLDLQAADYAGLVSDAEAAAELFPTVPEPYLYKGIALSQLKRYDEAIDALVAGRDMVVDNQPLAAQFWSSLGEAYNASRQFAKSDQAYDKALALLPNDPTTLNNYAYYLSLRGEQLEKAERLSKRSNDLAPGQPSYQDTYAWVLFRLKRYAEARAWIEKAIAGSPSPDGELLEHYGDILFESGEQSKALETWRRAKERGGASEAIDRKIAEGRRVE